MSDFAQFMERARAAEDKLAQLVKLAEEVEPKVAKAEPAVAEIVAFLRDHKAEFGL